MADFNPEILTADGEIVIPYQGEGLLIMWGPDAAALGGGTLKIFTRMGNIEIDQLTGITDKGEWPINPNIPAGVDVVVDLSGSTAPALEVNYSQGGA